jgi:hypothetical protein
MNEITLDERRALLKESPSPGKLRRLVKADTYEDAIMWGVEALTAADAWEADREAHVITQHQLQDAYTAMTSLKESLLHSGARIEALKKQVADIPGVDLAAKISVLRLWAEDRMTVLAAEKDDILGSDGYLHGKPQDWNDNIQGT